MGAGRPGRHMGTRFTTTMKAPRRVWSVGFCVVALSLAALWVGSLALVQELSVWAPGGAAIGVAFSGGKALLWYNIPRSIETWREYKPDAIGVPESPGTHYHIYHERGGLRWEKADPYSILWARWLGPISWSGHNGTWEQYMRLEEWDCAGVGVQTTRNPRRHCIEMVAVLIPLWMPTGVAATFAAWLIWPVYRARQRRRQNRCVRCGYDLRATPNRCPECGAATIGEFRRGPE